MKPAKEQSVVLFESMDDYINSYQELFSVAYLTALYQLSRHLLFDEIPGVDDIPVILVDKITPLRAIDFAKDELRKALVALTLKGYKVDKIANSEFTPDTISFIVGYIVSSYFKDEAPSILDPVVGTASMLTAVCNMLESVGDIVAIDSNLDQIQTARVYTDLLGYDVDYILEDAVTSSITGFDCVIADVPVYLYNDDYFPHRFVAHYMSKLNDGGLMVCVIPTDFFTVESIYKDEIIQTATLVGLINLPSDLFIDQKLAKSILIMEPTKRDVDEFLLIDLPRVEEEEEFYAAVQRMEQWFRKEKK
jgi:site-specific DNA-methyltransferase (adenine-specific)